MSKEIQRRNFLKTGGMMALAMQAGLGTKSAVAKSPLGIKPKVGLILYTIRDYLKTPEDITRSLERVKEIGYDYIEITSVGAMENKQLASLLKRLDLKAVSAHASWDAMVNEPQKEIDKYKELGCTHLVCSSMPGKYRNAEGYKEFPKVASEVGARLAEDGVTFGYHNHSFEFIHFDGKPGQQYLVDFSIPQFFNFEIDTYWIQHGGGDPAAWINKVAGRVPTVHFKDMVKVGDNQVFAEVGEGNLNWMSILDACKKAGVEYYIVEQDRCQRDPMESIAISYKNLSSWL